jgi:CHAT domain-containing protein
MLTRPQPLSLAEIRRQVLDDDTLLLEYSLGDQHSFLWAVTPASLNTYELPKRTVITQAARRVYELLTARKLRPKFETPEERQSRISRADAEYQTAAAELSQMVLGPVAAQLGNKRLLIVADGWLQYVPFAALPEPATERQRDGRTGKEKTNRPIAATPLMVNHEITNLPSASTLAVLRRELAGRQVPPKTVVVLGDPVFDKNDERVNIRLATTRPAESKANAAPSSADAIDLTRSIERASRDVDGDEGRGGRARLPFTRQEAKAILALAPADSRWEAIDFDASRATAISNELSQYRYVHFATHGFLDNVHPELSGLVLSQVDRDGNEVDGFLRLVEIFNLKLPAELVVLSGCRTGLGKVVNGEGLIGLTRGFMYAGAARVLVSLWDVNDQATAELMARFYRGVLKEKLSPAAALRAAQIEQQREKGRQSPYFWAGFTLRGEPR